MPLPMYEENNNETSGSRIKHVLAIAAGKGGVGKSTVAVNLARALKKQGYSVGLMDTDVYGPSVRRMLPEDRMPAQRGEILIPAVCEGIRMISMAYFKNDGSAAVVRAPIANNIVTQFIQNVEWGDLDFLLIDFPPGTGDIQLTLSQKARLSGALMVTTPQEIAAMDVRKAMNMFDQVQVPVVGVVENMAGYQHPETKEKVYLFGRGGGSKLAREAGVPFLGEISVDPELSARSDKGDSIFTSTDGETPSSAMAFLNISESLVAHMEALESGREGCVGAFTLEWKEMPE